MKSTVAQKTEIQQPVVNKGVDKETGVTFYVVKSDSDPNTWYQVRWNEQALEWQCNCVSRKPCKHQRAVNAVLVAQRQMEQRDRYFQWKQREEQDAIDAEYAAQVKEQERQAYRNFEASCGYYDHPWA
ncbi:MAG TPA: hypothetical protein VFA10_18025 [Ktedonobacteraceae bacterium]|nr:hypothetical protein [Ktedonobacteraceae bacterium]